jgi:hypothetical protein
LIRTSADRERFTFQPWVALFFDRAVKGIKIKVDNAADTAHGSLILS